MKRLVYFWYLGFLPVVNVELETGFVLLKIATLS